MKILSVAEQESFDKPPIFNSEERKKFFDFPSGLLNTAQRLRTPCHRIGFLLALGYFKASKKFFSIDYYHHSDIKYVSHYINIHTESLNRESIPETTQRRHRQNILKYYGFRRFDKTAEIYIKQEIANMVRVQLKPKLIFGRCIDLLIKGRIQVPNYNQLSKIILMALNKRKQELVDIIDRKLPQQTRTVLDELLTQEQFSAKDQSQSSRFKLTLLKKLSQSTKPSKVKERADDLFYLKELYGHLETILPSLELGHEGIRYYANSVIKSDIFHFSRRSNEDRYIHLIAFIAHQYYRLQDNLADVLLMVMQSYQNGAIREHRDLCYENHKQRDHSFKSLSILGDNALN